jgi:Rrf2 family transcriptional regulator, nitric oxide-sensitive transcriptional repressor
LQGEILALRLTQFSNFAVRVLMYAGVNRPGLSTLPQMARAYGVSYDHLKKAAIELSRCGYLQTVRGRGGGFRLAMAPEDIRLGTVVRQMEGEIVLVECFDAVTNGCPLVTACQLRVALHAALAAFFEVLDRYTLADLIGQPAALAPLLGLPHVSTSGQHGHDDAGSHPAACSDGAPGVAEASRTTAC